MVCYYVFRCQMCNFVFKKMLQLEKEMEVKKQLEDKQKEVEREQKRRERQVCSCIHIV